MSFISPIPIKASVGSLILANGNKSNNNNAKNVDNKNNIDSITSVKTPNNNKDKNENEFKIPSLDVLVDLCYKLKKDICCQDILIDHHLHVAWDTDKLLAYQFLGYCTLIHCQELLSFLIQIFKYEHLYYSIYPEKGNIRLNTPSPKFGDNPQRSSNSVFRRRLKSMSGSLVSIKSSETTQSCTSALPGDSLNNIWDDLMEKELAADLEDESLIEGEDENEIDINAKEYDDNSTASNPVLSELNSPEGKQKNEFKLTKLWYNILKKYILEDAPDQINLSNDTYREIMEQDFLFQESQLLPPPESLLTAKNEVLQLIKENAYLTFVSKAHKSTPSTLCKALGLACQENKSNVDYVELPYQSEKSSPVPQIGSPKTNMNNLNFICTNGIKNEDNCNNTNNNGKIDKNNDYNDKNNNNINDEVYGNGAHIEEKIDEAIRSISTPVHSPTPVSTASKNTGTSISSKSLQVDTELNSVPSNSKKKNVLRNLASPTLGPMLGSSSPSSLSAILGHWRLSGNSSQDSRSNSPSGGVESSPIKEEGKRRFWKHKK